MVISVLASGIICGTHTLLLGGRIRACSRARAPGYSTTMRSLRVLGATNDSIYRTTRSVPAS